MRSADLLWPVAQELMDGIRRHRPRDCLSASGAVQSWHRMTGRFAEGRFSAISAQQGTATSARYLLPHCLAHYAVSGLDPRVAAATRRESPGEAVAPGEQVTMPGWMDIPAVRSVLSGIDEAARGHDRLVARVVIDFDLSEQDLVLAENALARQESRLLSYLTIRVIAQSGRRVATGLHTPGASDRLDSIDPVSCGTEVARRAVAGLDARPAPVGHLPVVVAGGRGIVMLHEACCHPLEGDEVIRGSVYAGRIGERIASPLVTITDDPTRRGGVGSYACDDEGVPASPTTLIEAGVLTGYLTDRQSAALLGQASSGNGRCSTVLQPPQPRMSNTCLAGGPAGAGAIISSTRYGIYAQHVGGGEVVESTGEFTFRVTNGFMIENGRITDPIAETTISGTGTDVLMDIDAVASDSSAGAAKCGKFGQWVPVGVVGPTLRVRSLLVGGTSQ
ncbi:MAG TPA: TldD/PmbA family protein [Streptosporangiaceae bacterium]|nr:TldD/PmbA family protein [Streptosporangiaceae bacterium]